MASRELTVRIVGDSKSLERAFRRSSKSGNEFAGSITSSTARIGAAFKVAAGAVAAAGVAKGLMQTVSAASNLSEEINKSNVVFGGSAAAIQAWSKSTASSFGVSRRAALEAAGGFGSMLETAGVTETAAAGMSKRLVGLAADISSFNNIDPTLALEKLRSGLAGEAEPLRTVGVLLSEARVKAEAYADGIAKSGSVLTEAQKVQARYALILKDTVRQQGDFARTSKGLANSQRIIRAQFENIAASVGSTFLPALAKATSGFASFLGDIGKARSVRAKLNVVWDGLREAGSRLVSLWKAELEALKGTFARAAEVLADTDFGKVGRLVGAKIGQALRFVADAVGRVDWGRVGETIIRGFEGGVRLVLAALPSVLAGIGRLAVRLLEGTGRLLLGAGKLLGTQLLHGVESGLASVGRKLARLGLKIVLDIVEPFTHLPGFLGGGPFRAIKDALQGQLNEMVAASRRTATAIGESLAAVQSAAGFFKLNPTAARPGAAAATAVSPTVAVPAAIKAAAAAKSIVDTSFALPFRLRLAEARAAATKAAGDDLKIARQMRAFVIKAIPNLKGEKLIGAYQELGQATDTIANAAKAAAEKLGAFTVPKTLQLAQAKFEALGKDISLRAVLEKIRTAAQKALKSGKLGFEDQLDAWNTISAVNGRLKDSLKGGPETAFKKANTSKLIAGLGLDPREVRAVRARLSQLGPGGTVPRSSPGSPAFAGAGGGRTLVNHTHVYIDGKQIAPIITRHQHKTAKRNPGQRRGPHAGA